jgi:hypothetical protein
MATKSVSKKPESPRPLWQHPLLFPAVFTAIAFLFLVSGDGAFAFAFLLFALGLAMYLVGKARRWKGAPGAGLVVVGIGVVMALWALLG